LALQYQNENLVDRVHELQQLEEMNRNELLAVQQRAQNQQKQVESSPRVMPLVERFSRAQSKEEFIDIYLRHVADRKNTSSFSAVYFKYLPSVISFIATQGFQINLERTKGVGVKLVGDEAKTLTKDLHMQKLPSGFRNLLQDAFQVNNWVMYPLYFRDQVEGLVVFWGAEMTQGDQEEFILFQLCYQNIQLQKRVEALEVQEPITDLYTKDFFTKRIEEEVSRSRRLLKPVALVKLNLDRYVELGEKIGTTQRDLILRAISLLIKKTSRVNDFACRTGDSEISLILPHCSRKGASVRSERLRKAIENHSFSISGVQVTVSSGVSEYPSLCGTAEDLAATAGQALEFISTRGGNKVCLYKPNEDFKPDFDVPAL
jgi:diguanylate cyclase (GGDEF)-like protein